MPSRAGGPALRIPAVYAPRHGSVSLQVGADGLAEVVFNPDGEQNTSDGMQFFPQYAPQNSDSHRLWLSRQNCASQSLVNQRLVAQPLILRLESKCIEYRIIQVQSDTGFTFNRPDSSPLSVSKIVFSFHIDCVPFLLQAELKLNEFLVPSRRNKPSQLAPRHRNQPSTSVVRLWHLGLVWSMHRGHQKQVQHLQSEPHVYASWHLLCSNQIRMAYAYYTYKLRTSRSTAITTAKATEAMAPPLLVTS